MSNSQPTVNEPLRAIGSLVTPDYARLAYEAVNRSIANHASSHTVPRKPPVQPARTAPDCEMLTAADVARMLAIGERSVWRKSQDGRLPPPIKIGGSTRWTKSSIRDWMERHETAANDRLPRRPRSGK